MGWAKRALVMLWIRNKTLQHRILLGKEQKSIQKNPVISFRYSFITSYTTFYCYDLKINRICIDRHIFQFGQSRILRGKLKWREFELLGTRHRSVKLLSPLSTGSGWCMADSDSNLTSDDLHHTNWTVDVRTPSREWGGPTIIDLHDLTVLYFWYTTPIFKHIAMRYTFTRAPWLRAFKREISPAVYLSETVGIPG